MIEGINLCYTEVDNMLFEYQQKLNKETTLDRIKGEIAIDVLQEVLERINSLREQIEEN